MSNGRSSANTRTPSMTRPMPSLTSTANASSITRSIQSGAMNITTSNSRIRPLTGNRQGSTDRTTVSIRNIPTTVPSGQRRTSNDATRSTLTNQDRSVSQKIYTT